MAILLNGQLTPFFTPTRGVCQGDPLSPYLCILGMEFLSTLIQHQIDVDRWTPIPITPTSPHILHTHFADDIFLFIEAYLLNANFYFNKSCGRICHLCI